MVFLSGNQFPNRNKEEQFRDVDWSTFAEKLGDKLADMTIPELVASPVELLSNVESITLAISETIEDVVPISKPTPFMKRWWSKDIAQLRQVMRSRARLAYRHRSNRTHEAHELHRQARNNYAEAIARAKRNTWTELFWNLLKLLVFGMYTQSPKA